MKSVLLLALSATVLTCTAAQAASGTPAIGQTFLMPRDYHQGEAPIHPGAGWLALVHIGERWELLPAKVASTRIEDAVTDEPGQRTGVRIVSSRKNTLALLRRPYLTQGPLEVADNKIGESGLPIEARAPVDIRFKGADYRIETKNERVFLVKGAQRTPIKTMLVRPDLQASVSLRWAGDLDGDGELDLMMSYSGYNVGGTCLYLSSQKASGFLLKQVDCLETIGC